MFRAEDKPPETPKVIQEIYARQVVFHFIKGTVAVISNDIFFKEGHLRLTTIPFKSVFNHNCGEGDIIFFLAGIVFSLKFPIMFLNQKSTSYFTEKLQLKKIFYSHLFYFEIYFNMIWYDCHIIFFIIVFCIKQLKKLWKKTFITIHQLSCFVEHPVLDPSTYKVTTFFKTTILTAGNSNLKKNSN